MCIIRIITDGGGGLDGYDISLLTLGRLSPLQTISNLGLWKIYKRMFPDGSKPDIIHAHFSIRSGATAAWLAQKIHRPLVITEHWSGIMDSNRSPKTDKELCRVWRKADRVIAVSNPLAQRIHNLSGVDCTVVHNVVDTRTFTQVRRNGTPGFGFITCGHLISLKNHSMLLDAFAAVHALHPDARLGIIGRGELDGFLKDKARSLGVADAVTFYGRRSHAEMMEIYGAYDCFVFPSLIETFGIALAEGMAAGMPVIATRNGGPQDFVSDDYGVLIDPTNLEELISAMKYSYFNRSKYDRRKSMEYISSKFSSSVIAKQLIDIYESVHSEQEH